MNRTEKTDKPYGTEYRQRGFAMVEVLVGMAISAVLLAVFAALISQSAKISRANHSELKATLYLREAIEAVKDIELSNWDEINYCTNPCYPKVSVGAWVLSSVSADGALDGGEYVRSVSTTDVFRDSATNEIVSTGGVLDPDTKKVTAAIHWSNIFGDRAMTLETYVYDLP